MTTKRPSDEKLAALREAVADSAKSLPVTDSLREMFLGWADRFTVWHLRIGRLDDLMCEPSRLGHNLLRVGHFHIDRLKPGLADASRKLGRELHLIETAQIVCDGGASVRAVVERIKSASEGLTQLVGQLGTGR